MEVVWVGWFICFKKGKVFSKHQWLFSVSLFSNLTMWGASVPVQSQESLEWGSFSLNPLPLSSSFLELSPKLFFDPSTPAKGSSLLNTGLLDAAAEEQELCQPDKLCSVTAGTQSGSAVVHRSPSHVLSLCVPVVLSKLFRLSVKTNVALLQGQNSVFQAFLMQWLLPLLPALKAGLAQQTFWSDSWFLSSHCCLFLLLLVGLPG